jgi:hypothetical protein
MERGKAEESIHTLHKEKILAKEDKTKIYASEKLLPNCFIGILLQSCTSRPVPNYMNIKKWYIKNIKGGKQICLKLRKRESANSWAPPTIANPQI